MITFLLIVLLIISIGINISLFILVRNLLLKQNIYEQWILGFKDDIANTLEQMRTMDKEGVFATSLNDKGVFESDDQVGQLFKEMITIIEKLNQRIQ